MTLPGSAAGGSVLHCTAALCLRLPSEGSDGPMPSFLANSASLEFSHVAFSHIHATAGTQMRMSIRSISGPEIRPR